MSIDLELLTVARNYAVKMENELKQNQRKWTERFERLDDEMRSLYASKNELMALKERIAEFEQNKFLSGEIGIARMLLEALVNQCKNDAELIVNSSKIQALLVIIDRLVTHENTHRSEVHDREDV